MMKETTIEDVIKQHEESGYYFKVNGVQSFALDVGSGEPVLCLHGVPTSSFLYRKLAQALAAKGLRGISIDLPGLGLADRPADFDYSFRGLADFCIKATDVLGLEKCHLVVHDIGGPIGFALAAQLRGRILSLTILNTWVDVEAFEKPLPMRPFEKPVLGETELALLTHKTWHLAFSSFGVSSTNGISNPEIEAYIDLLKRDDNGSASLKIMRNFDKSAAFKEMCYQAVQNTPYPVQAIWGAEDPGLTYERYGLEIKKAAGLALVHKLQAKHLLQEEKWDEITDLIVLQAASGQV
ncbi:alpha/beta fold hydrolase [Pontibacter harenae]|uniref:alpha/beta fold hydrolase n=1 Tax=Pontibacter harenae TaxID=2894083 RepID=UPI001E64EC61|nr:alpha/beta fold hydrolase [Pontibacter harenae]MCC9165636.1 alpha/beta fold hydrolase [Pontibacter harenae]